MKNTSRPSSAARFLAGMLGLAVAFLFSGCTTADPETDAFYHRGWLWPKKLEQPYEGDQPSDDVSVPRKVAPASPGAFD